MQLAGNWHFKLSLLLLIVVVRSMYVVELAQWNPHELNLNVKNSVMDEGTLVKYLYVTCYQLDCDKSSVMEEFQSPLELSHAMCLRYQYVYVPTAEERKKKGCKGRREKARGAKRPRNQ